MPFFWQYKGMGALILSRAVFGKKWFRLTRDKGGQLMRTAALLFVILTIPVMLSSPAAADSQSGLSIPDEDAALMERINTEFTDDLDGIKSRKLIRVLASISRTNFFFHKGKLHGFEYELMKAYESFLNQSIKQRHKRVKMVFVPVPFHGILDDLAAGRGDIAVAGLTITTARARKASFTRPYITSVDEVVVSHKSVPALTHIEDLSGRRVYIRKGSSYENHLERLNRQLEQKGKKPVDITLADTFIVTEDILELVNARVVDLTIADRHVADAWASVLPDISIHENMVINSAGKIAMAVRKENQQLLDNLNAFIRKNRKGSLLGNILFKRYYQSSRWIRNPNTEEEQQRLKDVVSLFQKFGKKYDINYVALAAQAYQESRLDHSKISSAGAVGIMQVLPSTAADPNVDISDITRIENNVHAGVKYLDFLRQRYFTDDAISDADRLYFSWAAYNAGPAKINRLRRIAGQRGYDPNQWFFNVEYIAAEKIGRETFDYVSNIHKYYVAYQLYFDMHEKRMKRKSEVDTGS
jgi:membrane-bound lytic murein transglycosylase MltF